MDDYEILNKIGDGTFGTVYLCRKRDSNDKSQQNVPPLEELSKVRKYDDLKQLVAIKKFKKRYHSWGECMNLREVKALKRLNHRNIVLLKEVIRENNNLYLVFEYMEENLYQLIRRQQDPFDETTIRSVISQVLRGLAYIHKHGFLHRDIKPENLLCREGSKSIKIADFGLTREIESQPPFTDYVSTRWYRAPELLLHSKQYTWAVDIWAVGCIMAELYTLRAIFPGRSEIDQIFKICQVLGVPDSTVWPEGKRLAELIEFNFPNIVPLDLNSVITTGAQSGKHLIESMLKWSPGQRPSAKILLAHKYLKDQ